MQALIVIILRPYTSTYIDHRVRGRRFFHVLLKSERNLTSITKHNFPLTFMEDRGEHMNMPSLFYPMRLVGWLVMVDC